ncbi:MAG: hypothetical protein JXR25_10740 [Pontiellaceae bacterium]|nr:hypothetical protein [Pontiellaceae bacterium]
MIILHLVGVAALMCQSPRAEVVGGFMELNASWNMYLGVLVDTADDTVHMQLSGPDNRWFAVGFNKTIMRGAYTIVVDGNGNVSERFLGDHTSGSLLASSITVHSASVTNGMRTIYLTRARTGANSSYYTFSASEDTIDLIYARGTGTSFAYHGSSNRSNQKDLTKTVPDSPGIAVRPHGVAEVELQLTNLVYGVRNSLDESGNLQSNTWTTAEMIELAPPRSGPVGWLFSTNIISVTTNDTRYFRISR